jgi:hypothetical protein
MLEGDCTLYAAQPAVSYGNLKRSRRALAVGRHLSSGRARRHRQLQAVLRSQWRPGLGAGRRDRRRRQHDLTISGDLSPTLKASFPHLAGNTR